MPFGGDQRIKPVSILLMFASVLIGSKPRMGKTMALRILALACALDPTARIRAWELKGTGDLSAWSPWRTSTGPAPMTRHCAAA